MDNFEILATRKIDGTNEWFLLCHVPGSATPWVTWRSSTMDGKENRFWGHYHFVEEEARQDFAER